MKNYVVLLLMLLSSGLLSAQDDESTAEEYFEPLKYRNIGPHRGGRSVTATGVIGDPLTYYMGITGGGLWKTEDAGQYWNNISDGYFQTGSVGAVAVAPSDPNIIYCGMGEHAVRGVMTHHGDGVYKSIDAGKTWKHIGLQKTQHISRIVIDPDNPNIVYVAAQGALYSQSEERGVYKSIDGGSTWQKVLYKGPGKGAVELSMDANYPHILYAAMWEYQRYPWMIKSGPTSGLYKSVDSGATWTELSDGLPKEKGKMSIAVAPSNSEKVYALIEGNTLQDKSGLFVSDDGGDSWSKISGDNRLTQRAWYYIELFIDPTDDETIYVLSAPALRSEDGGKTWERITGTHGDYHDLWINPDNPKNLCIANDGGAAISFNYGETWSRQSNMPTSQFYRVNVDNQFPYNIYGGQQDNSSVKIASRSIGGRSITERDWTYSAGGESAFLAFDPDDPQYVMGGSYLGTIEVLDYKAQATTDVMEAPIQYLGRAARDMRYLFNWNAPIIWSQHEPGTFYHGAQYVLRTDDMGQSWREVSPDLTRNQDDKQMKGGGPLTVEAVGAENYGTLSYMIESPHEKGVLWTGSDDGLVQMTKDGGANWIDVTPKGLKECLINAIDISPHDPATAYIATTRYKFNDHTPAIYKTTNYGKSWQNISQGIPYGAFTRVVREDEVRKNLLIAGTETGIYVSWNGGDQWEPFNINLPVVPITDLIIRHDDLIVATSGRSFWILDDMNVLRQYESADTGFKIYEPEDAMLINGSSPLNGNSKSFDGTHPLHGVNPANGAVLYYEVPEVTKGEALTLDIMDINGQLIRTISSIKDSTYVRYDGGPPPAPALSKKKGLNRFVWDLRHKIMPGVEGVYIEASYRGHKVVPGTYTLKLSHGDITKTTQLKVSANPNYPLSQADYESYSSFMTTLESELTVMHNQVNVLKAKYDQIKELSTKLTQYPDLSNKAIALMTKLKNWDSSMIQRLSQAYDDVENFENKFTAEWMFLINQTESDVPRVNQGSRERYAELSQQWKELNKTGTQLLTQDIPQFNNELWDAGIGAIWSK